MIGNKRKAQARVGSMSLVGVSGSPPHSFGNYFDLWDYNKSVRVWNMWAENLEALVHDGTLDDGHIVIIEYENGCIVDDPRVPPEYLHNKLCFTGGRMPSKEEAREIYDILGDPNNEFEQFTDPVSYYKKRGGDYDPKSGIIRYTIEAKSRPLKATWTCEQAQDSAIYIGEGTLEAIEKQLVDNILKDSDK